MRYVTPADDVARLGWMRSVAVDRQLLRFVEEAGVALKAPEHVEAALTTAGQQLSWFAHTSSKKRFLGAWLYAA